MARPRMHMGILYCCLTTAGIGQSEKVKNCFSVWGEESRREDCLRGGCYGDPA